MSPQRQPQYPFCQPEPALLCHIPGSPPFDASIEPTLAVLTMSLNWERALAAERALNRQLNASIADLQHEIHVAQLRYHDLHQEHERVCGAVNLRQIWSQARSSQLPSMDFTFERCASPEEISLPANGPRGMKRKPDFMLDSPKKVARKLVLTPIIERPISPKCTMFNPETPVAMVGSCF